MADHVRELLAPHSSVLIHQVKEWGEILVDFETRNKYHLLTPGGEPLGFIAERNKGFWGAVLRQVLRSHRSMEIKVWNNQREEVLDLRRPFFWIWSDLHVTCEGRVLGSVNRRFAFFHKKYDLRDEQQRTFATIKAPFWRLWTFPILSTPAAEPIGVITKKWGGLLKEAFTDADKFKVEFPQWNESQKAVALAAAVCIDLDYFEDNGSRNNVFSG